MPFVQSLAAVLEANFANWSQGQGKLTLDQINTLMDAWDPRTQRSAVQGADAAALAVLKGFVYGSGGTNLGINCNLFVANPMTWNPNTAGLTLNDIRNFAKNFTQENPLQTDANKLNTTFQEYIVRIKTTDQSTLFADVVAADLPESPAWTAISQGAINDCSFLAATGSLIQLQGQATFKPASR
jgi:hypothetical protein